MSKATIDKLDTLSRTRLSKHFFMRDFLYSETAVAQGLANVPDDEELAIQAGKQLCEQVLEPIQAAWGRIHIRSAFRNCVVNQAGNELGANCATNEKNYAAHIWDRRDKDGFMGAMACIVIPTYVDYYQQSGDWTSLAWWLHHHIPGYQKMTFYRNLCAFNIRWHENPAKPKEIKTKIADPRSNSQKAILLNNNANDFYASMPPEQRYQACLPLLAK